MFKIKQKEVYQPFYDINATTVSVISILLEKSEKRLPTV